MKILNCKICGKEMKALRTTKRYCDECKQKALKVNNEMFLVKKTTKETYTLIIIDEEGIAQTYKALEQ